MLAAVHTPTEYAPTFDRVKTEVFPGILSLPSLILLRYLHFWFLAACPGLSRFDK